MYMYREKTVSMTRQVKTVTLCVTKLPTIEHEKNRKCGGLSFDSQFYTTDSTAFVVDDCIFTALTCIDCIDCGVDITAACSSYYIKQSSYINIFKMMMMIMDVLPATRYIHQT